jgi:hypothetical protein
MQPNGDLPAGLAVELTSMFEMEIRLLGVILITVKIFAWMRDWIVAMCFELQGIDQLPQFGHIFTVVENILL